MDAKALIFIRSALKDDIFSCILAADTSKQAWEILKKEYLGNKKVIIVKLQTLHHDFETLIMKDKESVQKLLSTVSGSVNLMRSYGEILSNEIVVSKVLRSLTSKFDHVVAAIDETKDLSTYTFDELMSSLIASEARLNRSHENSEEKVFQVKEESSKGRHDFHRRSHGDGKGRG
ncbi:uncharacterized protein [Gossypium hirsutum]|uniref:Uncharacterized protein n=1 Tax=Gossypium hirsutum TaxID=3635 RepID=A0A1U8IAB8_GOSHI|nr:uncharacterized protein LOC107894406 [Gossypium hirsutum]